MKQCGIDGGLVITLTEDEANKLKNGHWLVDKEDTGYVIVVGVEPQNN